MLKSIQYSKDNKMGNSAKLILDQALELNAKERATIAEKLLGSLDSPDSKIDALWEKEANSRVAAYKNGKLEAVSSEEVFSKYRKV
jgi:putative addiction module component (TIGR02574 family)